MTAPIRDPDLEGFLALARARLAPRTVESYRRDLEHATTRLGRPLGSAGVEELERYLAELRAAGLSNATVARRLAALRAFYRHQHLLGTRADNPAASIDSPRRIRRLPARLFWPEFSPLCSHGLRFPGSGERGAGSETEL